MGSRQKKLLMDMVCELQVAILNTGTLGTCVLRMRKG